MKVYEVTQEDMLRCAHLAAALKGSRFDFSFDDAMSGKFKLAVEWLAKLAQQMAAAASSAEQAPVAPPSPTPPDDGFIVKAYQPGQSTMKKVSKAKPKPKPKPKPYAAKGSKK